MSVRRIYVEKKEPFAVAAKGLRHEIRGYLGVDTVTGVRELIRYDVENVSDETWNKAVRTIFSEPPVDEVYENDYPRSAEDFTFSVEYLPGQFDQRADSAEQCVKLLKADEEPVIRTATTYVISGTLTEEQKTAIISLCLNPVDSRQASEEIPETLTMDFEV
ncbi:MAG: phosphoribosylformylglycinamidine synthase, partial [Lachnospiraceae bacterium]|nr:phosphoribosylformylglycinamidine synthase [Lachnospiraceae bacterium]